MIEGHAQPGAPPEIARRISAERGEAVLSELKKRKVSPSRLQIKAFATTRQLLRAADDREHRRAEILVTLDGTQFPAERLEAAVVSTFTSRFAAWAAEMEREGLTSSESD